MRLDVHSLAKLQQDGVPVTDDSPMYAYELGPDGKYGKVAAMLEEVPKSVTLARKILRFIPRRFRRHSILLFQQKSGKVINLLYQPCYLSIW